MANKHLFTLLFIAVALICSLSVCHADSSLAASGNSERTRMLRRILKKNKKSKKSKKTKGPKKTKSPKSSKEPKMSKSPKETKSPKSPKKNKRPKRV